MTTRIEARSQTMLPGFWRDRRTFVTGGTGLVGGWLVRRLLEADAEVVCLVRDWVPQAELIVGGWTDQVRIVRGDLAEPAFLERILGEYEVDTVFHLAAQTIVGIANRNPLSTFESNIRGTWNLLEACRRNPLVRSVVLASSDKAYGAQEILPYTEETPLQGLHPYDASKSCADLLAQTYAATFGLPVGITRCGNFYGGGDLNWNRIVPGTLRSLLRGEAPVIRSDGSLVRDYFYVEDGAAAYLLLAQRIHENPTLGGQAFNFSNEEPLSVLELVQRMRDLFPSPPEPVVRNEATNEIPRQHLSAAKARKILGWTPLFNLDQGLATTQSWYETFLLQTEKGGRP